MARLSNSFEGGTAGQTITPANSGGASGDAFSAPFDSSSAPTYSTTNVAHGTKSMSSPAAGSYSYVEYDFAAATVIAVRAYLTIDAAATQDDGLIRFYSGTTASAGIRLQGTNKFRAFDSSATLWTGTNNVPLNTLLRVEMYVVCGTGNATVQGAYYLGDSTTAVETFSFTTATTAASFTSVRIGKASSGAVTANKWWDDVAVDPGTTGGFIGPYTAPPPPAGTTVDYATITTSTGWTKTGAGTDTAVLADTDDGTYWETSDNPAALVFTGTLPALTPPAGDFVAQVRVGKTNAASGSIVGKLYEGATLRATSASVAVPNSPSTVNVVFLAANLTGVTSWAAGLSVRFEATAA